MNGLDVQLIDDQVLLKQTEAPRQTASGIVLPKQGEIHEGLVLAVGPGAPLAQPFRDAVQGLIWHRPSLVQPGDYVAYSKYAGQDVEIGGVRHKVLKQGEIRIILQRAQPAIDEEGTPV